MTRATTLNIDDPMAVFGFVMSQLPERVKVYPTENYYYFGFMHNGIRYAGNIRLDASNRDDGKADLRVFRGHLAVVRRHAGQAPACSMPRAA